MSRRTVFGSLLGLVFLVNLARVVFAPLLRPLGEAFGATDATLGLVATLAWLGSALPRIPTGYLLTRASRSRVVLGSGVVLTGASAGMSFARSVEAVMVGAFLMGLASGAYFIAANPLVSELFPARVGSALGVHGTASQVAAVAAAPFVLAALAVGDWRTTVRVLAVLAALLTVAFLLAVRRTQMPEAGTDDLDFLGAAVHQWRVVLVGVAVVGAAGLVWNGLFNFYVTFLVAEGLGPGRANLLLTVVFTAGVPAFLVTGRLADRVRPVPLILAIVGGFVLVVLALTAAEGFVAFAALSAALGYVIHGLFPAVDTYLLGSLPDHHRASAYAVYSGTMMVVQATGSSVVGWLADADYSFDAVFAGLALLPLGVLLAMIGLYATGRLPSGARA